jgi:hypothetical protein
MIEQFSTRFGRVIGTEPGQISVGLGLDMCTTNARGHVLGVFKEEALAGLHKFSPEVSPLGSYASVEKQQTKPERKSSIGQRVGVSKGLSIPRGPR